MCSYFDKSFDIFFLVALIKINFMFEDDTVSDTFNKVKYSRQCFFKEYLQTVFNKVSTFSKFKVTSHKRKLSYVATVRLVKFHSKLFR